MATEPRGIARIVVGVDGSEHSSFAFDWAIRMARGLHSIAGATIAGAR